MRKVLVVDDSTLSRQLLTQILSEKYEVIEAPDGRSAISLMYKEYKTLSAVLLDLQMPKMDGFQVLRLRHDNPLITQIPTIIITSNDDEHVRKKAFSLGANDLILKPFVAQEILNCLDRNIFSHEKITSIARSKLDYLTKIYYREAFFEKARELIQSHKAGYYLISCVNIDSFKVINDQYGTAIGDKVLQHVAESINYGSKRVGGICGRITADDFVVLIPAQTVNSYIIVQSCQKATEPDCIDQKIRLRIGRYFINDITVSVSAAYDRAKIAANSLRGNYEKYIEEYSDSMRSNLLREQQIITFMNEALETGQFKPWFQPQYDHSTGMMIGAEALVRWDKDGTYISPGEFIPLFEQNGFIFEMDKNIWEQVCKLIRNWIDEGISPLPISVNISRRDIFHKNFITELTDLVKKYEVPTELLRLEVTESAFSESTNLIATKVNELIDLGFTVEIDDFGSGYSSLNTLKDVPASILKLDMRFFENTKNQQRGGNIVESVVRMAKWIGMSVIAEGVETKEQADYLKSIGCFYIQGYFYAKPMPTEKFKELMIKSPKEANIKSLKTLKSLDNSEFWNPMSMDTLIFNSYAGAACIIEYTRDNMETIRANDYYLSMLKSTTMDMNDLLSLDWAKHMDEKNMGIFKDSVAESLKTQNAVINRYEFCNLPGCPKKIYLKTVTRVIATTGDRHLIYCLSENITAQKEAEIKEHNLSVQMKAILSSVQGGVTASILKDGKIELIFSNNRFYEMHGYSEKQYKKEVANIMDIVYSDDRERVIETIKNVLQTGGTASYNIRYIKRDGSIMWQHLNNSVIMLEGYDSPVLLAVHDDITELYQSQQKEKETSHQLRTVMDHAGNAITTIALYDNNPEFIFANDKFFEIIGYTREEFQNSKMNVLSVVYPEDRNNLNRIFCPDNESCNDTTLEYRVVRKDGRIIWIRSVITITKLIGYNVPIQIAVSNDITQQKETTEQICFLNYAAHDIIAQPDIEIAIKNMLENILLYFGSKRVYIMEDEKKNKITSCTYEVCAKGVKSIKKSFFKLPINMSGQRCVNQLIIKNTKEANKFNPEFNKLLADHGINSTIIIPILHEKEILGTIGIDDPIIDFNQAKYLKAIGDFVAIILMRRDLNKKIDYDQKMLTTLMNDTPGGFVRIKPNDNGIFIPVYYNDGFCKLLNMKSEAISEIYGNNVLAGVHPDDCEIVKKAGKKMLAGSKSENAKFRLKNGLGDYTWVSMYGKMTTDSNKDIYFNVFYSDATKEMTEEQIQKHLLDNLPCGAALYEYDGKNLSVIHINQSYWDFVKRTPVDYTKTSLINVVHDNDKAIVLQEINAAISQNRNISMTIRILYEDSGYMPFHIEARFSKQKNGKYLIFASYTPISKKTMSVQEMLPIALSTMMASSDAICYVKDKDLRYICCSRGLVKMTGLKNQRDIIGKNAYDLFDEKAAKKFTEDDRNIIETGKPIIDFIEKIPNANGKTTISATSKYPITDEYGTVIGVYCICNSITKQKENEMQLKLLTNCIPGGIATFRCIKQEIILEYYNEGLCVISEYSKAEFDNGNVNPINLVFDEDKHIIHENLEFLYKNKENTVSFVLRTHTKSGAYKWISCTASTLERYKDSLTVTSVITDITKKQEESENLRVREEEYRLATEHANRIICRYDIEKEQLKISPEISAKLLIPEYMNDVPYNQVKEGLVSNDTADAYISFFENIKKGKKENSAIFYAMMKDKKRWLDSHSTTIYDEYNNPVSAVISFEDVTSQQEKESIYKKWQQSLNDRNPELYTLYRINLTKNIGYDSKEGLLFNFIPSENTEKLFDENVIDFANRYVSIEDRNEYISFVNSDRMLANYYRGVRKERLEFAGILPNKVKHWIKLSAELVECPNSTDIQAYLLYEDINIKKITELEIIEKAETDPLTGILNRVVFEQKVNEVIKKSDPNAIHALIMMDIDGFKMVNDMLGHSAGDNVLIKTAETLLNVTRNVDFVGRLGGDEFIVFLTDIPSEGIAAKKAKEICVLTRKSFNIDVQISGSLGVAIYPKDGNDFDSLYNKADKLLYQVKETGKDNFAMSLDKEAEKKEIKVNTFFKKKKCMMIVDDSPTDLKLLKNLFKDKFNIEEANNGTTALTKLHHFGSAISVVLLDMMMEGIDGLTVLKKMQQNSTLKTIPVIMVSSDDELKTSLDVIRCGASDYITKPINPDLLRVRVESAIKKAEYERSRAQNSFLSMQSDEVTCYHDLLERMGYITVILDWTGGVFTYSPSVSKHFFGEYDNRSFWRILLSDIVTDSLTVQKMQQLVHNLADNRFKTEDSMIISLKTATGEKCKYYMRVYKQVDQYGLADKIIMAFKEYTN